MQFAISKQSKNRLSRVRAELGEEVGAECLALADHVRAIFPRLADVITDEMIALWITAGFINNKKSEILDQSDVYTLIAWYYIVHPTETEGGRFSDLAEPGVHRLARLAVQDSVVPGLPYTALMLTLYHSRSDVRAAVSVPGNGLQGDLICWFYLYGLKEFHLERCVTADEIAALNKPVLVNGIALLSILDLWALGKSGMDDHFDLTISGGQIQARKAAWDLRADDLAFLPYEPMTRRHPDAVEQDGGEKAVPLPALLSRPIARTQTAAYSVERNSAEYFGRKLKGTRLLLHGEWFEPELNYVWCKYPMASILFAPGNGPPLGKIGILLHPYAGAAILGQAMRVVLNGVVLGSFDVAQSIEQELVIRGGVMANIHPGSLNMLQIFTDRPLVPAELLDSGDTRRLGVAVRRFWTA